MSTVFYAVTHFILVVLASIIFIRGLREIRTPKNVNQQSNGITVSGASLPAASKEGLSNGDNEGPKPLQAKFTRTSSKGMEEDCQSAFIYAGPNNQIPTPVEAVSIQEDIAGPIKAEQVTLDLKPDTKDEWWLKPADKSAGPSTAKENPVKPTIAASKLTDTKISKHGAHDNEQTKQSGGSGETRKESPILTQRDKKAIQTVLLVCLWFLFCKGVGLASWIVNEFECFMYFGHEMDKIFGKLPKFMCVMFSLANFFFYLRGDAFRNTFKKRWLSGICN